MSDPETLWLNVTNIALGAVTLICLIAFGGEIFREAMELVRKRANATVPAGAHELVLSDLGVTMADGGVEIDEQAMAGKRRDAGDPPDEPNIVRSDN
jgi:hypothetical protein